MNLINRKLIHWIAAFAIAMSSIAPSISQAINADQVDGKLTMEICSSNGEKNLQFVTVGGDSNQFPQIEMNHCPYCVVQGLYVHSSSTALNFAAPLDLTIFPKLFYKSPKLLFAWISLPSQAPPQLV